MSRITPTYRPLIVSTAPCRRRKPGRTNLPARTQSPGGAAQHPVANAQTDGQGRAVYRHPQSFTVNPLTGILGIHIVTLCYSYVSPDGDGWSYGISSSHSLPQTSTDHGSLITARHLRRVYRGRAAAPDYAALIWG